jgi:hypothetical protein
MIPQDHAIMQSHIARWQTSGLSQTAFCQAHGIKPHIQLLQKEVSFEGCTGK